MSSNISTADSSYEPSTSNVSESESTTAIPPSVSTAAGTPSSAEGVPSRLLSVLSTGARTCWVCFGTDADEPTAIWLQPCRCIGSMQSVHVECLHRWVEEKQKGDPAQSVQCPQCKFAYRIVLPSASMLVAGLEVVERSLDRLTAFGAFFVAVGGVWWSAVSYGAVSVMQVAGYKEGLSAMERFDPIVLLLALPIIPVTLVLSKAIRWEEKAVSALYRLMRNPALPSAAATTAVPDDNTTSATEIRPRRLPVPRRRPLNATSFCSALALPTCAFLTGTLIFSRLRWTAHFSRMKRSMLGLFTFVAVKGLLNVYYIYWQTVRLDTRQVLNYEASAENEEVPYEHDDDEEDEGED